MKDIVLCGVSKNYGETAVYENFDLTIRAGEITCLLGASGCGVPGRVSYIFQEERLLPNLTVRQNIDYVLGKRSQKTEEMLALVELSDKADVYPSDLSGGQAQRVSIARAFAYPSELLLMDEPFSSLDTALKIRLTEVFCKLWERDRRTVVFVTHDVEEAYTLAHRAGFYLRRKDTASVRRTFAVQTKYFAGDAARLRAGLPALFSLRA